MAGVVIQLMLPIGGEPPDDGGVALRTARGPAPAMVPDYPAVLRAPVFSPDRRPGEAIEAGDGSGAAASLQLLGVAASGRAATALVKTPDGKSHVLVPGEVLQGWRLLAVLPDSAVVSGPAGRARLQVGGPPMSPPNPNATPGAPAAASPIHTAAPEPQP